MAAALIPRGPIEIGKSGSKDVESGYVQKILSWRESALESALDAARQHEEFDRISDYIEWISGNAHWSQNRPKYRSAFRDNRIAKARIESLSYLTDIKPTIDVSSRVKAYQKQADIAKAVIQHEWRRLDLDLELAAAIDHALFGVGYWKIGAYLPGRFTVAACGMDTVLPIQEGKTLQESTAILYRTFKPVQYFKNAWPRKSEDIEQEAAPIGLGMSSNVYSRPWNIGEYTWNNLSPAMRYHMGRRGPKAMAYEINQAFPVVELQEFWVDDWQVNEYSSDVLVRDPDKALDEHNWHYIVHPGERLFPRKRLIVFAGDRIMYDGPSPYWHGLYPFAKLVLNPIVWGPGGLSKYRDLIPLNKAINEVGAGILDGVKKALNPPMISKDGAVNSAAWEKFFPDLPGGKLKMTPLGQPATDIRWMDPPNIPGYVAQFLTYVISAFREMSGSVDVGALAKKKQVPGSDTVQAMQDMMSATNRLESRRLEPFLRDAGIQAVSLVFQFWTLPQRLKLLAGDGISFSDFDFDPNDMKPFTVPTYDLSYMFPIEIAPGSLHGASHDRERVLALTLARFGVISKKELLRKLEWAGDLDQIEAELKEERQAGAAAMGGRAPRMTRGQRTGQPI